MTPPPRLPPPGPARRPVRTVPVEDSQRVLWLAVRQGLLLIVAAIERYLGLPRAAR
jgi:hypothetical protein